jgi:hypothetical protein
MDNKWFDKPYDEWGEEDADEYEAWQSSRPSKPINVKMSDRKFNRQMRRHKRKLARKLRKLSKI